MDQLRRRKILTQSLKQGGWAGGSRGGWKKMAFRVVTGALTYDWALCRNAP